MKRESLKPRALVPDSDRFNSIHYAIHLRTYFLDVMSSKNNPVSIDYSSIEKVLSSGSEVFKKLGITLTYQHDLNRYQVADAPLILIQQSNFQFLLQIENKNDSVIIKYKGNLDPEADHPPSVSFVQDDVFERKSPGRTAKTRPAK